MAPFGDFARRSKRPRRHRWQRTLAPHWREPEANRARKTLRRRRCTRPGECSAIRSARPSRTRDKPASTLAASSATNRNEGVSAGIATSDRAAATHNLRIPIGSLSQPLGTPCRCGAEENWSGIFCSTVAAWCLATSAGNAPQAEPQPCASRPMQRDKPSTACCNSTAR